MEGPTPVSALIHAATMVTAGVFVMVRMSPMIGVASPVASDIIAVVGVVTALYAAACALTQTDIKRVLAYSTISQLGYTFLAIGVGAYSGAMFHVVTHAFFKALLFLGSGSVIHAMHGPAHDNHLDEQDMRIMGGLRKFLPITSATFIVGWLAIAGVFPFAGFWSKDEILGAAWARGGIFGHGLWVLGLLAAILTAFYMTRQVRMVFFGEKRYGESEHHPHESPLTMTIPLVVLSIFAFVAGVINLPFKTREDFARFLEPAIRGAHEVSVAGFDTVRGDVLAATSLVLALVGIGIGISMYKTRPKTPEDEPLTALGAFYHASLNAFYVNSGVSALVSGAGTRIANFAAFVVDTKVIDGAARSIAGVVTRSGKGLRTIQSGYVRRYLVVVAASSAILVVLTVWGVNR
jgi:NADH-quinone oxidoreductase subunit L